MGVHIRLQAQIYHWACLFVFFHCCSLFSQQPKYHHLGKSDGLPSDNIYDVLIDQDNYIWFSTDKGLARFDGKTFQNYTLEDGLPDNEIFSLYKDSKDRIWFGSFNGTPGFYLNGKFYTPSNCPSLWGIRNENYISAICEDRKGNIILGARDGRVHRVDFKGSAEFLFQEVGSMAAIAARTDGGLEVTTSTCEILTWLNNQKTYHPIVPDQQPLFQEVMVSTKLMSGSIVMGYGSRFSVIGNDYSRINYSNKTLARDAASILKIRECNPYGVFVCTSKGAYLFPSFDFSLENPKCFLPGKHVSNVINDSEGGLWFTTKEGVFYAPEPSIGLAVTSRFSRSQNVTSIKSFGKYKILLGYEDGVITVLDSRTGNEFQMTGPVKEYYALRANYFGPRIDGRFWVFTDLYLGIGDTVSKKIMPAWYVTGSDLDVNGDSICFCHSFGWQVNHEQLLLEQAIKGQPKVLGNLSSFERCFAVHYDNCGALWVATNGGLLKIFNRDTTVFNDVSGRLKGSRITDITSDDQNNVWISTAGAGLIWFHEDTVLHLYGPKYAFPSHITQIGVVSGNVLGVASDHGFFLIDYDKPNLPITWTSCIGSLDGLPSDEINDFCVVDNLIWIATPAGYSSFPLSMVRNRTLLPAARIGSFSAGGNDFNLADKPLIDYNTQGIRLSFSGVSFRSLGKFNYKYTLDGLDDVWHYSMNGQVEYPFLEPGDYVFQVYAQNHQGNWSLLPATYAFTILTPFWKSVWFRVLIVCFLVFLAFLIFWAILSSERKKVRLRQELNNAEQRALIGQMNPHFIFNSLNSIQHYYMTHDLTLANSFLSEFGDLIRSTLNNSRKPMVSLSNEISELRAYLGLEALRLNNCFEYNIDINSTIDTKLLLIPTMLLQPFLENSIWHGISPLTDRSGKIMVRFSIKETMLLCELEDNGIGRARSRELRTDFGSKRTSHAMNIAQERISLLNGSGQKKILFELFDLFDNEGIPSGTKIVLCFPIVLNQNPDHETH